MLNPSQIQPKHLLVLQSVLMNRRSKADEWLVSQLYRVAKSLFYKTECADAASPKLATSRIASSDPALVLAACTDTQTGLFIQLAGAPGCQPEALLMTFGTKYCTEWKDGVQQQLVTKMW